MLIPTENLIYIFINSNANEHTIQYDNNLGPEKALTCHYKLFISTNRMKKKRK